MASEMVDRRPGDTLDATETGGDADPAPQDPAASTKHVAAGAAPAGKPAQRESTSRKIAKSTTRKPTAKKPAKRKTAPRKRATAETKTADPSKETGAADGANGNSKPKPARTSRSKSASGVKSTTKGAAGSKKRAEKPSGKAKTAETKPAQQSRPFEQPAPTTGAQEPAAAQPRQRIEAPPLSPYRALLRQAHRLFTDRARNNVERVSTATEIPLDGLTVAGENRALAHDYRPSPRGLIHWVLQALPQDFDQTTFVDIGSGRGRVLFEAARLPFQRIVGIECAAELHEDAALNLRHWPRALMRCREVDLVLGDAFEQPLPDGDLVVWMFDPFAERLMTRMAARLAEHARRWNVTVVIVEPRGHNVFEQSPTFQSVGLPRRARRRIALFSPYPIAVFTAGPKVEGLPA